jgi:hypothetical protein
MPPVSYIVAAVLLIGLVAISLPPTMGFAILYWYWIFGAAACLLAIGGAFLVRLGMRAPLWVGVALASPGIIWAATTSVDLFGSNSFYAAAHWYLSTGSLLASVAAAIASLRLVELIYSPRIFIKIGYGVLGLNALLEVATLGSRAVGWPFANIALFDAVARIVVWPAIVLKFGAFLIASASIVINRRVEWWTAAAIGFVSVVCFYDAARDLLQMEMDGLIFFAKPGMLFIGAVALCRMGRLLLQQARQFQALNVAAE